MYDIIILMAEISEGNLASQEGNRISKDIISHLKGTERVVEMDNPRIGAIHGTSLETLNYLLAKGTLPGRMPHRAYMHYQAGDISVFPTTQLLSVAQTLFSSEEYAQLASEIEIDPNEFRRNVIGYAGDLAEEHGLLTALNLPLEDAGIPEAVRQLLEDDDPAYFLQQGKTATEISEALEKSAQLRGFLLGFSPTILHDPQISFTKGDPGEYDLNLRTGGRGLSYKYISAIEPLGDTEKAFLQTTLNRNT